MLVKAKMGFWVCLLYYPNLNIWKIPVFFKIKKSVLFHELYSHQLKSTSMFGGKNPFHYFFPCFFLFCFTVSKKPSFFSSPVWMLPVPRSCFACSGCSATPSEGQNQPKHLVNHSVVHLLWLWSSVTLFLLYSDSSVKQQYGKQMVFASISIPRVGVWIQEGANIF